MKKKKNYYLIVPSSDIYVKTKDDSIKIIDHGGAIEIFKKHGIPTEYQKVVIKVSLENNFGKELSTNSVYLLRESLVKSILSNSNESIFLESTDNIVETKLSLYNINKVKEFYQELIDNKLSVNYEKTMKEIYRYHYLNKKNNKLKKIKRNEYIH